MGSTSTCSQSPTYGKQCLDLSRTRLSVAGIEAHFAQAPDFFTQTTWTFETTTYRCDPRGRSKTNRPTSSRTYGSLHHGGNPNLVGTVCTRAGAPIARPVSCSRSLNFVVPHTFAQQTLAVCRDRIPPEREMGRQPDARCRTRVSSRSLITHSRTATRLRAAYALKP
jgi:hypothetical protein